MNEKYNYDKELENYFEKYGTGVDTTFLSHIIRTELSDMVFEQHQRGCHYLNFAIIGLQLTLLIISLLCSIVFKVSINTITCGINLALVGVVMLNNAIHTVAWQKAKDRLNIICIGLDIMPVRSKIEVMRELEHKFNINFEEMLKKQTEEKSNIEKE